MSLHSRHNRVRPPLRPLLLAALLAVLPCRAQWWQAYSESTGLVLNLHLTDTSATLYSPLQSADAVPATEYWHSTDSIRLKCASIGFSATLRRVGPTLQGTWRQGIMREAVTFLPVDTLFRMRRPQEEAIGDNRPYTTEELATDYIDPHGDSIHLEGTLTLPAGAPRAALLLVSGSGQQDRDETVMGHRPFLVLADHLARHGIATLRYDDRGVNRSRGPLDSADTPLFAADAEALFLQLRLRLGDRPSCPVGIGGHSEGALIAAMVAARNDNVDFVVMLAGQDADGASLLTEQNEALFLASGVSPRLAARRAAMMTEVFDSVRLSADMPSRKAIQAIVDRHLQGLTDSERDTLAPRGTAFQLHRQLALPWMQTFLRLDPARYLPQVSVPLLALGGSLDRQVPPASSLPRIAALCPQAETKLLPGLNHLFQHAQTGAPAEYLLIEETFAPEAMDAVADWILTLSRQPNR